MISIAKELQKYPQVSAVIVAIVFMAVLVNLFDSRVEKHTSPTPLVNFPLVLGDWVGSSQSMIDSIFDFLKISDYALVDYKSGEQLVNLYIAYYQSLDEEAFPHSPRQCIPAGGWEIETISKIQLAERKVRRVSILRDGYTQIVYYWYQQGGNSYAGEYQLKWHTMLRSLWEGRTDTSLVRLTTLVAKGESEDDADARLAVFTKNLDLELNRRLN